MPFVKERQAEVVVGPIHLTVPIGTISPDHIRLWPENPRIRHLI